MKKLFILIISIATFSSCSNDDTSTNEIVGEWQLIKAETYGVNSNGDMELFTTDYSQDNIIYNFSSSNELSVSGGDDFNYPDGTYDYIFGEDYLSGAPSEGESKTLLVKIYDSKWTYELENGIMILGRSYVDGSNLYFRRK